MGETLLYTYNKSSTYSLRCGPQLHSHSLCLHLQPDTSESRWPLPSCPQQQNHRRGACEPAVVSSCLTRCQSPLSLNYTSNPVTYWESLLLLPRCFAVCMHNTRVVGGTSCQRGPWNPNSAAGKTAHRGAFIRASGCCAGPLSPAPADSTCRASGSSLLHIPCS